MLSLLPWQGTDWARLVPQFDRLPHAMLFIGPAGIGTERFVASLAQALLCEQPQAEHRACGQCVACHWLAADSHPDFRRLSADEEATKDGPKKLRQIKIEAVRHIIDFAHLSAHRGGNRVIVIEEAETLNLAAANALLKILEEPPEGVFFLLTASQPQKLLATLRSRCRLIPLTAPAWPDALHWLHAQGHAAPERELAYAGGAPLALLADELIPHRDQLLAVLMRPQRAAILSCAADLDRSRLPLEVPLNWLSKWLYDLSAVALQAAPHYHPHAQDTLQRLAARITPPQLMHYHTHILTLMPFGQHTLSVRLQLERLLFDYLGLFARQRDA